MLALPLLAREELKGVLNLSRIGEGARFRIQEFKLAIVFSGAILAPWFVSAFFCSCSICGTVAVSEGPSLYGRIREVTPVAAMGAPTAAGAATGCPASARSMSARISAELW